MLLRLLGLKLWNCNIFILAAFNLDSSIPFCQSCLVLKFMTFSLMSITVGLVLIVSLTPSEKSNFISFSSLYFRKRFTCTEKVSDYSASYGDPQGHAYL